MGAGNTRGLTQNLGTDLVRDGYAAINRLGDELAVMVPYRQAAAPAHKNGLLWLESTTGILWVSDGASWTKVSPQGGTLSPSIIAGTSSISGAVSFPAAFPATPQAVILTPATGAARLTVQVTALSSVGFNYTAFTSTAANLGSTTAVPFYWLAR